MAVSTAGLGAFVLGCGGPDLAAPAHFTATFQRTGGVPANHRTHLTGDEEVPPRATAAQGQAIFQVSPDGESVRFRLQVANIENVLQAHIHLGALGTNGPVVVFLYPPAPPAVLIPGRFDGALGEGTFTAADLRGPLAGQPLSVLIEAIRGGNTYANVHTSQFTGGEIRGQILQNGR
jgi:hypothetical protein